MSFQQRIYAIGNMLMNVPFATNAYIEKSNWDFFLNVREGVPWKEIHLKHLTVEEEPDLYKSFNRLVVAWDEFLGDPSKWPDVFKLFNGWMQFAETTSDRLKEVHRFAHEILDVLKSFDEVMRKLDSTWTFETKEQQLFVQVVENNAPLPLKRLRTRTVMREEWKRWLEQPFHEMYSKYLEKTQGTEAQFPFPIEAFEQQLEEASEKFPTEGAVLEEISRRLRRNLDRAKNLYERPVDPIPSWAYLFFQQRDGRPPTLSTPLREIRFRPLPAGFQRLRTVGSLPENSEFQKIREGWDEMLENPQNATIRSTVMRRLDRMFKREIQIEEETEGWKSWAERLQQHIDLIEHISQPFTTVLEIRPSRERIQKILDRPLGKIHPNITDVELHSLVQPGGYPVTKQTPLRVTLFVPFYERNPEIMDQVAKIHIAWKHMITSDLSPQQLQANAQKFNYDLSQIALLGVEKLALEEQGFREEVPKYTIPPGSEDQALDMIAQLTKQQLEEMMLKYEREDQERLLFMQEKILDVLIEAQERVSHKRKRLSEEELESPKRAKVKPEVIFIEGGVQEIRLEEEAEEEEVEEEEEEKELENLNPPFVERFWKELQRDQPRSFQLRIAGDVQEMIRRTETELANVFPSFQATPVTESIPKPTRWRSSCFVQGTEEDCQKLDPEHHCQWMKLRSSEHAPAVCVSESPYLFVNKVSQYLKRKVEAVFDHRPTQRVIRLLEKVHTTTPPRKDLYMKIKALFSHYMVDFDELADHNPVSPDEIVATVQQRKARALSTNLEKDLMKWIRKHRDLPPPVLKMEQLSQRIFDIFHEDGDIFPWLKEALRKTIEPTNTPFLDSPELEAKLKQIATDKAAWAQCQHRKANQCYSYDHLCTYNEEKKACEYYPCVDRSPKSCIRFPCEISSQGKCQDQSKLWKPYEEQTKRCFEQTEEAACQGPCSWTDGICAPRSEKTLHAQYMKMKMYFEELWNIYSEMQDIVLKRLSVIRAEPPEKKKELQEEKELLLGYAMAHEDSWYLLSPFAKEEYEKLKEIRQQERAKLQEKRRKRQSSSPSPSSSSSSSEEKK